MWILQNLDNFIMEHFKPLSIRYYCRKTFFLHNTKFHSIRIINLFSALAQEETLSENFKMQVDQLLPNKPVEVREPAKVFIVPVTAGIETKDCAPWLPTLGVVCKPLLPSAVNSVIWTLLDIGCIVMTSTVLVAGRMPIKYGPILQTAEG